MISSNHGVKYRKILENETEDDINDKLRWELDYIRKLVIQGRKCYADCTAREQRALLAYHLYSYKSPIEALIYLIERGEQRDIEMLREEIALSLIRTGHAESIQYLTTKSINSNNRLLESLEILMKRVFVRIIDNRFIGEITRIELARDYAERMREERENGDNQRFC